MIQNEHQCKITQGAIFQRFLTGIISISIKKDILSFKGVFVPTLPEIHKLIIE
jgi:hypothetical protein